MMSTTRKDKTLILVDGSSYLFRAYHAMPSLTNSKGEPTGAIYGITNMLRKLLSEWDPEYIAMVFDARGRTFRDDLYEAYKANRPPTPEDLSVQVQTVHEIVEALGLPLLVVEGVEADDVIGTLTRQACEEGMDTLISTGDKDLAQLVNERVTLVNTMTDTVLDPEGVLKKFGVGPDRIVDYLALVGDTSDNIPGIPKVGPKTAVKWLQQYGSLDEIVAHAFEIKGAVGESLRTHLDNLPLSRKLATIKCDVSLGRLPSSLRRKERDVKRLKDLYARLEFRTWLGELSDDKIAARPRVTGKGRYDLILEEHALDQWLRRLDKVAVFSFDTETTSLDTLTAEVVGISFSDKAGEGAYIPLAHRYLGVPEQLDCSVVLEKFRALLESPEKTKVFHNLKFDLGVLENHGFRIAEPCMDTMLESYVLNSTASRHDMDSLALKYLDYRTVSYDEVTGTGKNRVNFELVDVETAGPYAAEDADITLRLHEALSPELERTTASRKILHEIEIPLARVLSRMERNGVRIDADMLRRHGRELDQEMKEVEAEAQREAGRRFNLASPKQIQEVLYEDLKIQVSKKTPKGQASTSEEVLQELALQYRLPELILQYRSLSKLKSTYTDKLPAMTHPRTGRVHTSYHQAVTATGRLSSSEPNLQNIPVRTEEGRKIRAAFIAGPDRRIISADYSQVELGIMAHVSGDPTLLRAFSEGKDIHRATAAELNGLKEEEVTPELRRYAKAVNFGLIYGMSAFGLSQQLKIERGLAQKYIDIYFERYPGVRDFMEQTRERARKQGYVETLFGRRLHIPDIHSSNRMKQQAAERAAINAPMQGTAADLIKLAMLAVDRWIEESGEDALMIMQVHDELVFEVQASIAETVVHRVRELMSGVADLSVPLVVDAAVGNNWDEAH